MHTNPLRLKLLCVLRGVEFCCTQITPRKYTFAQVIDASVGGRLKPDEIDQC